MMKRLLVTVFAGIVGVPLLLLMIITGAPSQAGGPTPIAISASDAEEVAAAPALLRDAFIQAARTVALPAALLVAVAEISNNFATNPAEILRTARRLLTAGAVPGGGWDPMTALTGYGPTRGNADDVLALADAYGYTYRPNGPPIDATRYVFPLDGPTSYTNGHHDYPATDIFTPIGTPVVASVRSEVLRMTRTEVGLGGITVTLRGEDGWRYYYAHLSTIEPSLRPGQIVEAGQLLAASGNTGNARTTPPHVHFGISITGSAAGQINPYPYLQTWPRPTP
jgi:murein DD-endopeptidase MepM/ murein hydrolase activator NlpD